MKKRSAIYVLATLATAAYARAPFEPALAGPVASASPSAAPTASANAPAPSGSRPTLESYAWPTEASARPKDEDFKDATELEPVLIKQGNLGGATCKARVIREWLQLECNPGFGRFFGVVWGVAGALKDVRAWFKMLGELGPPTDQSQTAMMQLSMGSFATVTLPVRPGSATLLSIDEIGVDEEYAGTFVFSRPGIVVDVTWAAGEKSPTIAFE